MDFLRCFRLVKKKKKPKPKPKSKPNPNPNQTKTKQKKTVFSSEWQKKKKKKKMIIKVTDTNDSSLKQVLCSKNLKKAFLNVKTVSSILNIILEGGMKPQFQLCPSQCSPSPRRRRKFAKINHSWQMFGFPPPPMYSTPSIQCPPQKKKKKNSGAVTAHHTTHTIPMPLWNRSDHMTKQNICLHVFPLSLGMQTCLKWQNF